MAPVLLFSSRAPRSDPADTTAGSPALIEIDPDARDALVALLGGQRGRLMATHATRIRAAARGERNSDLRLLADEVERRGWVDVRFV